MRHGSMIGVLVLVTLMGCGQRSEKAEPEPAPPTEQPRAVAAPDTSSRATPAGMSNALDGKTFEIEMTDPTGAKQPDKLVFDGGTFESKACMPYGFSKSGYKAEQADGALRFSATTHSPTDGTMEWSGTIRDSRIDGTAKATNLAGKVTPYTFGGSLQTGPGA